MGSRYQVIITKQAETSLEQILDYLLNNVSYEAAEKIREGML